jgi:hypothetical protein
MNRQSIIYSLAAIACSVAGTVHAAELAQAQPNVMFCIDTKATGLFLNSNGVYDAHILSLETRYTVNIINGFSRIQIMKSGMTSSKEYQCSQPDVTRHPNIHFCSDRAASTFIYNAQTRRYTLSTQSGYVYGNNDNVDVSLGTCQRF